MERKYIPRYLQKFVKEDLATKMVFVGGAGRSVKQPLD
jgi:hypothetical protein